MRQHVAGLSGGQRQAIAVAKAVMWNSRLVILDEPTAALDRETQAKLMSALSRLEHTMSVVLITHRYELLDLEGLASVVDDAQVCVRRLHLPTSLRALGQIDLAGYSFGAWVNALAATNNLNITNMVMVSPPVAFIDFGSISDLGALRLIVTGSRDDIAPPDLIEKSYHGWNAEAQFEIISGADHFYVGYIDKLESILVAYLEGR